MTDKKKKTRTTIHDIARELNITASTVSRALHNHPRISEATKKAVIEVAQKLHYQPNVVASNLRRGKGNTIGVIVPHINRHFFSSVIAGIEDIANSKGYNVIICQTDESYKKECDNITALIGSRVDGVLASISKETRDFKHFEMLGNLGVPLIFFDRIIPEMKVSKVVIDDFEAAYKAVEHLIVQGKKRIAHLTGPIHVNIYNNRKNGYVKALQNNGIPIDESLIIHDAITKDTGFKAAGKLFSNPKKPDAIFCAGDFSALGVTLYLKKKNIKIPEEVAVIGFANEPFTAYIEPSLTSVEQHAWQMGQEAAKLFIKEIADKEEGVFKPECKVLIPDLIIRESSKK